MRFLVFLLCFISATLHADEHVVLNPSSFHEANRANAYNTYLLMEKESASQSSHMS